MTSKLLRIHVKYNILYWSGKSYRRDNRYFYFFVRQDFEISKYYTNNVNMFDNLTFKNCIELMYGFSIMK